MILTNDLFYIIKKQETDKEMLYNIKLNGNHVIYTAHFPGNPITPGVCLMQMVTELLESHSKKHLILDTVVNIKFRKAITPDMEPSVTIIKTAEEDKTLKVRVSIDVEGEQYAKMSLLYNKMGKVSTLVSK
ncbi:MAG: 3-hydroxyacyl-ACP dehydratase [Prevotella sp.]|jgi:3-hydroxyacyl-[acyl-carrier-protein] dehydratase|nr:3-hydroxyacyl-ACP dehydratase [Prevotella sp.]